MTAWLSVVIVALTAHSAAAQVRDRAASPTGGASISGTVMSDSQPSTPVRRASVTVNSVDRRVGKSAITDDAGKFLVTGLPAGSYVIGASKRAWVTTSYGAKVPGRPGRAMTLADGERATVTMRMARGAAITGTILDHTGQPASGAFVRVMRYAYTPTAGERRLVTGGNSSSGSDERGVYRIWGLPPGEYYVSVTNTQFLVRDARDLLLTSDVDVQEAQRALQSPGTPIAETPQRAVGLVPVLYPGTTDVAQATPITLRAGEERAGIDLTLQYASTSRVSGHLAGLEGSAQAGVQVYLISQHTSVPETGFESIRTSRTTAGGAFEFGGVRPGRYTVAARASLPDTGPGAPAPILAAMADVEVHGEDVRGLSLQLQEGLSVAGTVRFDGTAPPPPLASVRVSLATAEPTGFSISSGSATAKPDGSFFISGVTPGRYRLTAFVPGTPAVWTLRSSIAAGQDALDGVVDIREPIAGAEITLTDRQAELSGKIQDAGAADYTIVLYSPDRNHWRPPTRRVMTSRTANDGTFTFRSVPPGEYMLAAVEDVEPGEWYDPTFLQRLLPSSMKVSIGEAEKKVQDVRVGGG
jgi:protocatechuate 3,4-dioxygenase beta subunit